MLVIMFYAFLVPIKHFLNVHVVGVVAKGFPPEYQGPRFDLNYCHPVWNIWSSICSKCDNYDLK